MPRDQWQHRSYNQLRRGDPTYGKMYGMFSALGVNDIDLDVATRRGHRVHRSTDIGQEWMRKQAAMEYVQETMNRLFQPLTLGPKS